MCAGRRDATRIGNFSRQSKQRSPSPIRTASVLVYCGEPTNRTRFPGKGLSMRRMLAVVAVIAAFANPASATGLLIPTEKKLPPLAMLNHHVNVSIDDQVAVTRIEQTFRNHTDRQLEATYVFPVPKGASV